jgi:hypothetical protein
MWKDRHVDDHIDGVGVPHAQREAAHGPDAVRVDREEDPEQRPDDGIGDSPEGRAEENEGLPTEVQRFQEVGQSEQAKADRAEGEPRSALRFRHEAPPLFRHAHTRRERPEQTRTTDSTDLDPRNPWLSDSA